MQTVIKKENNEPKTEGRSYQVDSRMSKSLLREFLFGHYYRLPSTYLALIVGILAVVVLVKGDSAYGYISLCVALFAILGFPISCITKPGSMMKTNPLYQHTFHYVFDEWGVHVKIGNQNQKKEWKYFIKVVCLKNQLLLYSGKNNAYLIPYEPMGEEKDTIVAFIKEMVSKKA